MAYIKKETAAEMRKEIKALYPKAKFSVTVRNNSTIECAILESDIDFQFKNEDRYTHVNNYHLITHYEGKALAMLQAISEILHTGHYDRSDSMTDYFDCAWYIDINIGKWDKPYIYSPK